MNVDNRSITKVYWNILFLITYDQVHYNKTRYIVEGKGENEMKAMADTCDDLWEKTKALVKIKHIKV